MDTSKPAATIKCWVELYSDSMYSWALHKTSNKEMAEDLVQDTFMAALQSINNFKGESNPKTWLFAILKNKINDHYRRSFRNPIISDISIFETLFDSNDQWKDEHRPQRWADETGHLLDNDEFQQILQNCMKKLPGNWFSAIQLKFMEEKNSELICQELEITPTNFWQILHRAKLKLRKCLELNWFKK
ncbi:MAG: sigma-70 family RNA polymerase sigma factor [Bacteroidetes bacterium]|nr:sigma-70 family RNA polymerase sigma factor [Bacteroidota bacterium]MBK7570788.1 sigma-70 family RNA polymerase sigma factor [Bacteroidota bacterium]